MKVEALNILFVTFGLPVPPDSGARIRDFNLISRVAQHHKVSVLSLLEFPDELDQAGPLREICAHVDGVVARRASIKSLGTALEGLLEGRPVATTPYFYPEFASRIRELTDTHCFELVQIEHSFLAPYRDALSPRFTGATVLSLHNIGVYQYRSIYEMSSGMARVSAALKWLVMRRWEAMYARRFDQAVVVSGCDAERLQQLEPECVVTIVENGVDCHKLQLLAKPQTEHPEILFVGTMGYLPNRDGLRYFCRDIFPLIRSSYPDCRLTIVGSGGLEYLADLAQPGRIEITGRVPDLERYYSRAQVVIVPLRSGGGSRLKILEAMALGRPVVSTLLGREGLTLQDQQEILTADDADVFARHVVDLLGDERKWADQVGAARRRVELDYDWDSVAGRLLYLYQDLCPPHPGTARPAGNVAGGKIPQISVIVPVFNMREDLSKCIDSLESSTLQDYQLIIVDDHSSDGSADVARARCDHFFRLDRNQGQAAARNLGARHAGADLLFFLDADVLVETETLAMVLDEFEREPEISAMFCSYQHDTLPQNFVSQFKNLQHHYTHQISSREAITFCGGFGAIKKSVFDQQGGFDESQRAMEDVDLGYRLHRAGHKIRLCPRIQLTHTKKYTLGDLVQGEVLQRAIPWTRIMLANRLIRNDLNTKSNNIASVVVVFLMCVALLLPVFWSWWRLPVIEASLLLVLLLLNRRFLSFVRRMRSSRFALRSVPMILLQYFYSGVGLVLGVLSFAWDRLVSLTVPSPRQST